MYETPLYENSSRHHDVIVVGARCAGAATAMLLARTGLDVLVIDKADFPSDTLSTHALSRGALVQLDRWGLLDDVVATGAPPVRQVRFTTPDGQLSLPVKNRAGLDFLLAPRRIWLDAVLVDAAKRAGAELRTGTTVRGLLRDDSGRVTGVETSSVRGTETSTASLVVIADGLRSRLVPSLGAAVLSQTRSPSSTFYAYVSGLGDFGFEFHLADRAMAGVFPTHDDQACVWIGTPTAESRSLLSAGADRRTALTTTIAAATPELGGRLARASWHSEVRGAANLPNVVRVPYGPGWALVGDAGYHRDPITGHGITDAFRDAELLARAAHATLVDGQPADEALAGYAFGRNRAIGEVLGLTKALTGYPGVPAFVALQKQLSEALDREAVTLAAQPPWAGTARPTSRAVPVLGGAY